MASKKRQRLRMRRLYQEAVGLQRQRWFRNAKRPCETCAFVDPEAFVADINIAQKILDCLQGTARGPFYCHEGMSLNDENTYEPPRTDDGRIDIAQMTPCGGFIRWAKTLWNNKPAKQAAAVALLQRHMLSRYFESNPNKT